MSTFHFWMIKSMYWSISLLPNCIICCIEFKSSCSYVARFLAFVQPVPKALTIREDPNVWKTSPIYELNTSLQRKKKHVLLNLKSFRNILHSGVIVSSYGSLCFHRIMTRSLVDESSTSPKFCHQFSNCISTVNEYTVFDMSSEKEITRRQV